MNIQIFNLVDSSKLKNIDKNLSIPSPLYYENGKNSKNLNTIVTNFSCNKNDNCIDKNIFSCLVDNIKPTKQENKNYSKQITRRRNRKQNSTRKTSKK